MEHKSMQNSLQKHVKTNEEQTFKRALGDQKLVI